MRAAVLGMVLLLGGSAGADPVGARSHLLSDLPPMAEARSPPPGRTARILGLSAWAVSTAALALAIFTWQRSSSLEAATSHDLVMLLPSSIPTPPAERAFFANPSCSPPSTIGNTGVFRRDCDLGQQYNTAATALLVGSVALGVAGTVLYLVGASRATHALDRPVAVSPILSPSFGGLVLRTDF